MICQLATSWLLVVTICRVGAPTIWPGTGSVYPTRLIVRNTPSHSVDNSSIPLWRTPAGLRGAANSIGCPTEPCNVVPEGSQSSIEVFGNLAKPLVVLQLKCDLCRPQFWGGLHCVRTERGA